MSRTLILCIVFLFPACGMLAQTHSQPQRPFSRVELLALVAADPRQVHLGWVVARRGIDFQLTENYLNALRASGARDALIEAVRKAPAPTVSAVGSTLTPGSSAGPASPNADAVARENQVLQHLSQAAKLKHDRAWPEEEQEIRSALAIEPGNPLLHLDLATVVPSSQGEPGWDAAIAESREALRLEPNLAAAHLHIGIALAHQRHTKDAIAEFREVLRLDPDDASSCARLGRLLEVGGDSDGAVAAYEEAIARNPDEPVFHKELAELLERKGDQDGAIAQAREAIRITPDDAGGHFVLAKLLRSKGDEEEAAKESQIATVLQLKSMPKRIRVGGAVMSAKLVHQVRPTYPAEAKRQGIQGTVRLEAVIGKDGTVQDMTLISGQPDLAKAAMKAVSKWRYQPILLNGDPVEVATEIDVNFLLAKR